MVFESFRKRNDNRTKDTSPRERGDRSVGDPLAGRLAAILCRDSACRRPLGSATPEILRSADQAAYLRVRGCRPWARAGRRGLVEVRNLIFVSAVPVGCGRKASTWSHWLVV
jgi:hypothetical protein